MNAYMYINYKDINRNSKYQIQDSGITWEKEEECVWGPLHKGFQLFS